MTSTKLQDNLKTLYHKFKANKPLHFILFGIGLAIMLLAPYYDFIPGGRNTNGFIAPAIYYTVAALGLNLLLGYSGLISLATAAFIGVGAVSMGYFMLFQEFSFFISFGLTLLISLVLGLIVGLFSLKVSGIYLTIGTLFFASILNNIFQSIVPLSTTESLSEITLFGEFAINTSNSYTHLRSGEPQYDRYIALLIMVVVLVAVMIGLYNIVKSKTGRAFMAMSRSANAASAMGINIAKYRIIAFITASMLATVAGVLYTIYGTSVEKSIWNLELSLFLLAVVVVGGMKSFFGTFIGALVIFTVPPLYISEYLRNLSDFLSERFNIAWQPTGFSPIFAGLLIIVVVLYYPSGLIKLFSDLRRLILKLTAFIRRKLPLKGGGSSGR